MGDPAGEKVAELWELSLGRYVGLARQTVEGKALYAEGLACGGGTVQGPLVTAQRGGGPGCALEYEWG